jgi:hypothetical protein
MVSEILSLMITRHMQFDLFQLIFSPVDGLRVLADADTVGISTWRPDAAALWITSVEDTAASTYDFHTTHGKTNLIM